MTTIERKKGQNGHEIVKGLLIDFWARFNGRATRGLGFKTEDKIAALVELANTKIAFHKQQPLRERRTEFNEAKERLLPLRRFGTCFACHNWATARHHIIQLQHGGINSKKNLVSLCDACHAEIHPWL